MTELVRTLGLLVRLAVSILCLVCIGISSAYMVKGDTMDATWYLLVSLLIMFSWRLGEEGKAR